MLKKVYLFCGLILILSISQTMFGATFTVTKTDDTNDGVCDTDCSLREAVSAANGDIADDIVEFDSTVFNTAQTITLTFGEIVILNNGTFTFNGTGANMLTIDGNSSSRIITVDDEAVAEINDATFTNGNGDGAANSGRAGAIYINGGIATINNSVITGNTANNGGGSVVASGGNLTINNSIYSNNLAAGSSAGALQNFSSGTLVVNSSTFMNNTSNSTTGGGAMQLNGTVSIVNSTFAGNTATGGDGGGISSNGSFLLIANCTFSGNTAGDQGGGIIRRTTNTNIFLRNNIIAGNTSGDGLSPDVFTNSSLTSEGNNIVGEDGPSMGWDASDLLDTDPMLMPLADNGGFGMTFVPMTGSMAIEGGQNCVLDMSCKANNLPFDVTTDQRGLTRLVGASVDIGSVEVMAGNVRVSGKVVDSFGRGIPNVILTISQADTGIATEIASTRTNQLGNFNFADLPSGETYTINSSSRRYSFPLAEVIPNSDIEITITADSDSMKSNSLFRK